MSDHQSQPPTVSDAPGPATAELAANDRATARRAVLRGGGLGVLGAVFLAACGAEEGRQPGVSGSPTSTTETPPTVPAIEPTEVDIEEDNVQFQTARTVELLVADVYETYAPRISDAEMRATAERFGADHTAAAEALAAGAPQTEESGRPNEFLIENVVDPIAGSLVDDQAILAFMDDLESALTATYIAAAGILTSEEDRQQMMTYGGASARRVTVLAGGGAQGAPTTALYPLEDLIPGEAYLLSPTDAALAEEADAEDAEAGAAEDG
jgi:hypothetical protein